MSLVSKVLARGSRSFVSGSLRMILSGPSLQKLDEFPYCAISEDSPHAKSGRETEPEFRVKLAEYRERFGDAFSPVD